MECDTVAGDAEAAGAIAGMIETYGVTAAKEARVFTVYVNTVCTADGNPYTIQEYEFLGMIPGDLAALRFVFAGKPHGSIFFHHVRSAGQLYHSRREAIEAVADALQIKREAMNEQIIKLRMLAAPVVPQVEDVA